MKVSVTNEFISTETKNVFCTFVVDRNLKTCLVDQAINSDDYIIASPFNATTEQFKIEGDEDVEYLPSRIVESFPNMKILSVAYTGLTVVRNYFFKNMRNLHELVLSLNKIATFDAGAFEDLVSVKKLYLHNNMIQALDEKLFTTMVRLEKLWLQNNNIEFLSPATFKIPNGKLLYVNLEENFCYLEEYRNGSINQLESDISTKCAKLKLLPVLPMITNSKRSFIPGECEYASVLDIFFNKAMLLPAGSKNLFCTFALVDAWKTCSINQTIDSKDYVIGSPPNATIQLFNISYNNAAKHLPRNISDKFPNLHNLKASHCNLTVVAKFYFENMRKLQFLILNSNRIASIEVDSFKDLVDLKKLWLYHNLLETLDEKLFAITVKLEFIDLKGNKIKFLNPETLSIPGGKLERVDLTSNVCIDKVYTSSNLGQLNTDLKTNCTN